MTKKEGQVSMKTGIQVRVVIAQWMTTHTWSSIKHYG
jgi:hypothetical protein